MPMMNACEDDRSGSRVLSQNENGGSTAAPKSEDVADHGLQRMLDLQTELRCYILELLIVEEQFDEPLDAYYTLLEHPEIGELVRCNFNAQFKALKRNRNLAGQLVQILTTTVLLSSHAKKLHSSQLAEFLASNLLDESPCVSVDNSTQAVAVLNKYQTYLLDADILTDQFAKMTIGNAVARHEPGHTYRFGTDTLSKVEYFRVPRAFLRLQLYAEIRRLYGAKKGFKRKIRSLFSLWTTWEFDEVRSLVEWITVERPSLPKHYAKSIRILFASISANFHNDMTPYVKIRPAPFRDLHRRSKFTKKAKRWSDTPTTPGEGRADARNRDWKPLGYVNGCFVNYTQRVYREHFLAGVYPFWCRYTIPQHGWWNDRDVGLQARFGKVLDSTVYV
ncbi:hypothetical protein G6011_09478 [Alternaria panax]|uniref:Uncharacterized protein n=1 Tax=Alternaria panax TaxID=48097 RepID=A0AAD4IB46_9PLEO|nr:hypothetical protein G6011_09478 [Alternaria panax]